MMEDGETQPKLKSPHGLSAIVNSVVQRSLTRDESVSATGSGDFSSMSNPLHSVVRRIRCVFTSMTNASGTVSRIWSVDEGIWTTARTTHSTAEKGISRSSVHCWSCGKGSELDSGRSCLFNNNEDLSEALPRVAIPSLLESRLVVGVFFLGGPSISLQVNRSTAPPDICPHVRSSFAIREAKDDVPGVKDARCPSEAGENDIDEEVMVATSSFEDRQGRHEEGDDCKTEVTLCTVSRL